MGRRQDESEAARKQLVEQSREFKKTASEVTHVSIRARFYYNCVGLQPAESPCVLGENFVHYYCWTGSNDDEANLYDMTRV